MSHNIEYRSYPEKVDKKAVVADLNDYVRHVDWQEGASGLLYPIRWLTDDPRPNYEDAQEFLKKHDKGYYDNLAVRYLVPKGDATHRIETAVAKHASAADKAFQAYNILREKLLADFMETKTRYIGCKHCGSRLSKDYLKDAVCPLCKMSLLSDTATARLEKAREKVLQTKKDLTAAKTKAGETMQKETGKYFTVKWLVKYEYHT